jgi:hypothetical protein
LSEKWAEKLSGECGLSPNFLKYALEELSESCFGDTKSAREIIEELTLTCGLTEDDVRRFIAEVSKNCPIDPEKLYKEIVKAEGEKEKAFDAVYSSRSFKASAR